MLEFQGAPAATLVFHRFPGAAGTGERRGTSSFDVGAGRRALHAESNTIPLNRLATPQVLASYPRLWMRTRRWSSRGRDSRSGLCSESIPAAATARKPA